MIIVGSFEQWKSLPTDASVSFLLTPVDDEDRQRINAAVAHIEDVIERGAAWTAGIAKLAVKGWKGLVQRNASGGLEPLHFDPELVASVVKIPALADFITNQAIGLGMRYATALEAAGNDSSAESTGTATAEQ